MKKKQRVIVIENKANKRVMWVLVGIGLWRVFIFSFYFGIGFAEGFLGR